MEKNGNREQEIILTVLKNIIEAAKEEEELYRKEEKEEKEELQKRWNFLDEFSDKHRKEFEDNGFPMKDTYTTESIEYIKHPLFGAYNQLSSALYFIESDLNQNYREDRKSYYVLDRWTTGATSFEEISCASGLSSLSVKNILLKLMDKKMIERKKIGMGGGYHYWVCD